ncbi:MAG: IS21 family transposase [Bacteroidetes bacterium]|nr:IS21 family transposase [Bacteroidota bacterium]
MANKTILMSRIRQIFRLHAQGRSKKQISILTGCSRNTVKKYLYKFVEQRLTYTEIDQMSDHDLEQLFCPTEPVAKDERFQQLLQLLPEVEKQMKRKGMTIAIQWEQYRQKHPDGYGVAQFYRHYRDYMKQPKPVMHMEHKAGDKVFIDFAGEKLSIVDRDSGELQQVEVFVAILGCSQLTYVEAVYSQKKEDLVRACENALHYFGGVPAAIVPDNLKSAVTKSSRYEPTINETFADFAEHYGTVVLPARAYRPKDKALVEGSYRYIGRRVKMLYTSTRVEIYAHYERIAAHTRHGRKYHYTTNPEHLASAHRFLSDWTPEKFIEDARAIDEAVADYIIMVIEHKQHPEQAYKSCSGILSLARKVGNSRLINACKRAGEYSIYNYPIVVQILDKNLDRMEEETKEAYMPQHDNIRGSNYYE